MIIYLFIYLRYCVICADVYFGLNNMGMNIRKYFIRNFYNGSEGFLTENNKTQGRMICDYNVYVYGCIIRNEQMARAIVISSTEHMHVWTEWHIHIFTKPCCMIKICVVLKNLKWLVIPDRTIDIRANICLLSSDLYIFGGRILRQCRISSINVDNGWTSSSMNMIRLNLQAKG